MPSYKISKLQVTNFRNLNSDIIEFSPNINCITGLNGNGKTNILEAIYVITNRKSFRKNTSFPQFLSIDGEKPEILFSSSFKNDDEVVSYSGKMEATTSNWFFNGGPVKKKPDIPTIFINPFDSYEFHNNPSARRRWFDLHIGMLDIKYKKILKNYNQGLRFRNTLLSKQPPLFKNQIMAIDKELAEYSVEIILKRNIFLDNIRNFCKNIFKEIFSEDNDLQVVLDSKFNNLKKEQVYNALQENIEKDCLRGFTSYGVHKDDYMLLFNGLNSYDYCSLGQQKISYLSLLFAYIELFRYNFSSFPIVLIDDVSGELDQLRWQGLINYLGKREFQVVITTANEKFKDELEKISGINKLDVSFGSIN